MATALAVTVPASPGFAAAGAAAGADSVSLGRLVRLSPTTEVEGLRVATSPKAASESAVSGVSAVVWTVGADLRGRRFSPDSPEGTTLTLGLGLSAALSVASDGTVLVGFREGDQVRETRLDEAGSILWSTTLRQLPESRPLGMGFFANGGAALAVAGGAELEVNLVSPEGLIFAETTLSPVATAGEDRSPRVSVHGNEVLVGWDRFAACSGAKEKHVSVVARLDCNAQLVRNPRRFSSGACGRSGKRLRLLDGPSLVGSLAVFQDRSARRFITGLPPQSELEFSLSVASGEEIAALSMDDGEGHILVVTRTTASGKPVRLFAQGFGRDGQARTPKVSVDGGVGSSAGSTPAVAASLDAGGNARIAFTRSGSASNGLFLRELEVRIP